MTSLHTITATRSSAWPFLLGRIALRTATVLVPLLVLLLLVRRLAGELQALPGVLLVVIGGVAVVATCLWRRAWRHLEGATRGGEILATYLPPATLALMAVALSIGGTHPLALISFWAILVGEEVWFGIQREHRSTRGMLPVNANSGPLTSGAEDEQEIAALLPVGVSQQITRTADAQGEQLECVLRVNFTSGEQTQTVHVAFCPPLLFAPLATAEHLDGAACEVKVTAAELFGARLEVKRRGALALEDEAIIALHVVARDS